MPDDAKEDILQEVIRIDAYWNPSGKERAQRRGEILP